MSNLQVSIVLLRAPSGLWFIHRRQASKKVYAGLWGVGIGGKVDPGETPLQAAHRELREESGILDVVGLTFVMSYAWHDYEGMVFIAELEAEQLVALQPCVREFDHWEWANPERIQALDMQGLLCPDTSFFWKQLPGTILRR